MLVSHCQHVPTTRLVTGNIGQVDRHICQCSERRHLEIWLHIYSSPLTPLIFKTLDENCIKIYENAEYGKKDDRHQNVVFVVLIYSPTTVVIRKFGSVELWTLWTTTFITCIQNIIEGDVFKHLNPFDTRCLYTDTIQIHDLTDDVLTYWHLVPQAPSGFERIYYLVPEFCLLTWVLFLLFWCHFFLVWKALKQYDSKIL